MEVSWSMQYKDKANLEGMSPFSFPKYNVTELNSLDFDSNSSRALAEEIVSSPQTSPLYYLLVNN